MEKWSLYCDNKWIKKSWMQERLFLTVFVGFIEDEKAKKSSLEGTDAHNLHRTSQKEMKSEKTKMNGKGLVQGLKLCH